MRLKILIELQNPIIIPWDYRTALTKITYELLALGDPTYAKFLHDTGFRKDNKVYRLFVYSDLHPLKFEVQEDGLGVAGHLSWQIASVDKRFIDRFMVGLDKNNHTLLLFGNKLKVLDALPIRLPSIPSGRIWRTISPVVVSTWDGQSKHATYRSPEEAEFVESLENNLLNKWEAFHKKQWFGDQFGIRVWSPRSKLVPVFNINVRGWHLNVQMWGPEELIRFAYYVGLGERNSQGFGMLKIAG